jgi:hypothetical protein
MTATYKIRDRSTGMVYEVRASSEKVAMRRVVSTIYKEGRGGSIRLEAEGKVQQPE